MIDVKVTTRKSFDKVKAKSQQGKELRVRRTSLEATSDESVTQNDRSWDQH